MLKQTERKAIISLKKKKDKAIINPLLIYYWVMWVPANLTGKVFDGCIRDPGFNPYLYQKLIDVLV